MKKGLVLVALLLLVLASKAQDVVSFKPNWKVGDKRTMIRTNYAYSINSTGTIDTLEIETVAIFEVLAESDEYYTLKLTYANAEAMIKGLFINYLNLGIKSAPPLEIIYQITKDGRVAGVTNIEDILKVLKPVNKRLIRMSKNSRDGQLHHYLNLISTIKEEHQHFAEAWFSLDLDLLLQPYSKKFPVNDTLTIKDSSELTHGLNLVFTRQYQLQSSALGDSSYIISYRSTHNLHKVDESYPLEKGYWEWQHKDFTYVSKTGWLTNIAGYSLHESLTTNQRKEPRKEFSVVFLDE